jgi:hypothetical protein
LGSSGPKKGIATDGASQLLPTYFYWLGFFWLLGFKQVHLLGI